MNKLESLMINENGFSFDPFTGETYTINGTGVEILKLLRNGLELTGIARQLASTYQLAFEEIYQDVFDFCEQLKIYGILQ